MVKELLTCSFTRRRAVMRWKLPKVCMHAMEKLKKSFPTDIDYVVPFESVSVVKVSIHEVVHTLLEALVLVILVVFLFLQSWRATLIPVLAIPVSIIGTFAFFIPLGFTINTLTLFGFVLAIGIVVDDAIVVVEAVQHYIDHEKIVGEGSHLQGHEGYFGAGYRHCTDSGCGVCSGRFYSRYCGKTCTSSLPLPLPYRY